MSAARIGVVLAGGRATRMGGDKAGAMLGDRTLLAHAIGIVRAAGLQARVCARADTVLPAVDGLTEAHVWREPRSGHAPADAHPLRGVAHAARTAGEPIVVLPLDLPLLPPAVLTALAVQHAPLAVVGEAGRPAALIARVDWSHADALDEAADTGAPALRTLLAMGAAVRELTDLAPGLEATLALKNVNDASDLEAARVALD